MFGKAFSSMYEGSMVGSGLAVYAIWGYCIAKANRDTHTVMLNPILLSSIFGKPEERDTVKNEIIDAINYLCQKDDNSKNTAYEGRRLVHQSGFEYLVVSHDVYRSIKNLDDIRDYEKQRKQIQRNKNNYSSSDLSQNVPGMSRTNSNVPDKSEMSGTPVYVYNTSSSTSTDLNTIPDNTSILDFNSRLPDNASTKIQCVSHEKPDINMIESEFEIFRNAYPGTKLGHKTEWDNFRKKYLTKNIDDANEIIKKLLPAIKGQINAKARIKSSGGFCPEWPHLRTWINQKRWEEIQGESQKSTKKFGRIELTGDEIAKRKSEILQECDNWNSQND